ncbi:hypothetical protein WDW86_06855 [Bdellovibrionota bacterium FG-2]
MQQLIAVISASADSTSKEFEFDRSRGVVATKVSEHLPWIAKASFALETRLVNVKNAPFGDVSPANEAIVLARYFDSLVNNREDAISPLVGDRSATIESIQNELLALNQQEIADALPTAEKNWNPWEKSPSETVIGKVIIAYKIFPQSDESRKMYKKLAIELAKSGKRFPRVGFFGVLEDDRASAITDLVEKIPAVE